MARPDVTNCRECDAPMMWVKTRSGKNMPLDADPTDGGDFYLTQDPDTGVWEGHHRKGYPGKLPEDVELFTSHFATCTNASRFRKPR